MNADETVRVRPMMAMDVDRVVEIAAGLVEAPHWPPRTYLDALKLGSGPGERIALVAQVAGEGTVVGFAMARLIPPEAELETIGVAAEWQRRGVGRILLEALKGGLRVAKINKIFLEVRASNSRAQSLYRSLGFVETGRRPCYYTDPVEDAQLMSLPAL